MSNEEQVLLHDLECQVDTEQKQPKMFFAGDAFEGQPYLVVTEDDIAMVADRHNVVAINPKFGIGLFGRVSLSCMPDQLSFGGGYWRLDPRHLSVLPSTTPTPIPLLVKSQPLLLKASRDVQDANSFLEQNSDIGTL